MVTLNYVGKMLLAWTGVNLVKQSTNKQKPNNVYCGVILQFPKENT